MCVKGCRRCSVEDIDFLAAKGILFLIACKAGQGVDVNCFLFEVIVRKCSAITACARDI